MKRPIEHILAMNLMMIPLRRLVQDRLKDELKSGVQTIQYQINTLMTTNGQSPFVTLFLNLDENNEYIEENAMIVEEILRQRLEGIKNENGCLCNTCISKVDLCSG